MGAEVITLIFLVIAIILFVTEVIPLSITAMLLSAGFALTGILTPAEAFAGFVDSNVLLFIAMFIIGAAIFETGMAKQLGSVVTSFAKTERQLIVVVMLITGIGSGFLSNTGTAAVLIPVVVGIAQKSGFARGRFLLPLVIAAAMGGNLSLVGAPGNMIAQSALQGHGMEFGFFEYAKVGLPILLFGILYFAVFGYKFLPSARQSESGTSGMGVFDQQTDYSTIPNWKRHASLAILVLTVLAMVFEKQIGVKLYVSAWIGELLLVVFKVIDEDTAMKSIDMKTIFLFVGSLSLAAALQKSGAGNMIADGLVAVLGSTPSPMIVLAIILVVSAVLTNFMSNTATTALLVPIGLLIAERIGADPKAVLMATVVGASLAYATPIGMPANAMVYGIGNYRFNDYVKAGLPLVVLSILISFVLLPLFFPFYP